MKDIDFDIWIDKHRQWFAREFPWAKRLQEVLAQEGAKVDTIDLLIESGDLWRFAWPENSPQRILDEVPGIIQEVANRYDVNANYLISADGIQREMFANIKAFEKWLDVFDKKKNSSIFNSIHAATFLTNTRSLVWFVVNGDDIQIQEKQQVLDLLEEQVKITSNMLGVLNQVLLENNNVSVCLAVQHDEHIKKIKDNILSMMEIERELLALFQFE